MDKKIFIKLFRRLLSGVAELFLEQKSIEGLKIYSATEWNIHIPVIITNSERKVWLKLLDPKMRKVVNATLENRLALISTSSIMSVDEKGEVNEFQCQFVLNAMALEGLLKNSREEFCELGLNVAENFFIEACCVAYICHEFRHLVQIFSFESTADFYSNLRKIPQLQNDGIPHVKLRKYWHKEIAFQMDLYKKHYTKLGHPSKKTMLLMEKDAMIVQMLAFDCWLSSQYSDEEKMLKLQEILQAK